MKRAAWRSGRPDGRRVVVHHDVQLPARVGLGDKLEEGQELAVWVTRTADIGHLLRRRGMVG